MPGRTGTSKFIKRCVADVTDQGMETDRAFAICTAQSQKTGYSEPGSRKITGKGKRREKQFARKGDMPDKAAAYERAVQREDQEPGAGRPIRAIVEDLRRACRGTADEK